MLEEEENDFEDPFINFRNEFDHDDLIIQVEALKRLPLLAAALGQKQSIEDLLPFLEGILDRPYCHDQILYMLVENLDSLIPYIGGIEQAHLLFPILEKIAQNEDSSIRDKAVSILKTIIKEYTNEQVEILGLPIIHRLAESDWYTAKCAITELFAACYPKCSEEQKDQLRSIYRYLCQHECPLIRKSCAKSLVELLKVLELEYIKNEFIPVFDNLAKDDQDNVRIEAINVGITIASIITRKETEQFILKTLLDLSNDLSWRVRYQFAVQIVDIQNVLGPETTRSKLIHIFKYLARDTESQIREVSAAKMVDFCRVLQSTYQVSEESPDTLDPLILSDFIPLVVELDDDPNEEVKEQLTTVLATFATILGPQCTKQHLLPLIISKIEEDNSKIKENFVSNLNSLISVIGLNDLADTVHIIMTDLLKCQTVWRTKRNLVVPLCHVANHSTEEYFDLNLKQIYLDLLQDDVYAVRRTAPLILPLLAKRYKFIWLEEFIRNNIFILAENKKYLLRLVCIFCIDELLYPTLEVQCEPKKYLGALKEMYASDDDVHKMKIAKIVYNIQTKLSNFKRNLSKDWVNNMLQLYPGHAYYNEDIKCYAEEALEDLKADFPSPTAIISKIEVEADSCTYLEGLFSLLPMILKVINYLRCDRVENVKLRAVKTLANIIKFVEAVYEELKEEWVKEAIGTIPPDDEIFKMVKLRTSRNTSIEEEKTPEENDSQKEVTEANGGEPMGDTIDNPEFEAMKEETNPTIKDNQAEDVYKEVVEKEENETTKEKDENVEEIAADIQENLVVDEKTDDCTTEL